MDPYHNKLSFGLVGRSVRTPRHLLKLVLDEVTTQRSEVVGEDTTLNVVVLVLDDTSRLAGKLLVVLYEVLIEVAHTNGDRTTHILVETWE